ncbi:helix-turn-helix transcriptional regulator [Adhaeribacter sp. BT258]|uniref:Helix-turn-helix transcriptional regulator n=1 Tax=Adhaeribacter terrigena TaxID=2793070 RepID=A0ABS1C680_9BACT|nr:AraC family transcriptional regulator [Adhaeribacter terrigena]MBK0404884.1 helix-turn-helix transcriptional regulator [Adhaeribacter terrigena]
MQKATFSKKEMLFYNRGCDVFHLDHASNRTDFSDLAPNSIISSCFTAYESQIHPTTGLGVKYVSEGKETYWLKGKKSEVTAGKYLLINESEPRLDVKIKCAETWGMCANIEPAVLNDLIFQVLFPNKLDEMNQVQQYLLSPELLVRQATASDELQQFLNRLIGFVGTHPNENPPIELIYELASLLVRENLPLIGSYYKLGASKRTTRQELFQRLLQGKEMLDDSVFSEVNIGQVADECCLSEFRFFRLFKQCFEVSPYQYLFRRRIEKSLELKKQNLSWGEIAYQLNFTDLAAFSKGFKKITGVSPSQYVF